MRDFADQQGIPSNLPDSPKTLGLTGAYVRALSDLTGRVAIDMSKEMPPNAVMCAGATIEGAIVFIDIGAYTSRSRQLSQPQLAFWVNRFFRDLWPVCQESKATYDKTIGDCMMLVLSPSLGCPKPLEGAFDLASQAISFDLWDYRPHVGIAYGPFWLGGFGPPHAFSLTPVGEVVNMASRLAGRAGARTVALQTESWETIRQTRALDRRFKLQPGIEPVKDFDNLKYMLITNTAYWSIPAKL